MHRQEAESLVACALCGAMIEPGAERGYVFGWEQALCFECAERRGGSYDANQDQWTVAPQVKDLHLPVD